MNLLKEFKESHLNSMNELIELMLYRLDSNFQIDRSGSSEMSSPEIDNCFKY